MTTTTKLVLMLCLGAATSLLQDYGRYENETISFYVPSSDDHSRTVHRRIGVNRRGAPDEVGHEHLVAVIEPAGIELHVDQAHDLYTPTYKEFVIGEDGETEETASGPPKCIYKGTASKKNGKVGKAWVNACESAHVLMEVDGKAMELEYSEEVGQHVLLDLDDFLKNDDYQGDDEDDLVPPPPPDDDDEQGTRRLTDHGLRRRLRANECSGSTRSKTIKMVIHHEAARTSRYGRPGVFNDAASLMATVRDWYFDLTNGGFGCNVNVQIAGQFAFTSDPSQLRICKSNWNECLKGYRAYIQSGSVKANILKSVGQTYLDTAQFFRITGYGTVGIAYRGTLCDTRGFNVGISGQIPNDGRWWMSASTIAHELGHTANMEHTFSGSDDTSIMGYGKLNLNRVWVKKSRDDFLKFLVNSYGRSTVYPLCLEDGVAKPPAQEPTCDNYRWEAHFAFNDGKPSEKTGRRNHSCRNQGATRTKDFRGGNSKALYFDGSDNVECTKNTIANVDNNAKRTICAWARAAGANDGKWITLFRYGAGSNRRFDLQYRRSDGRWKWISDRTTKTFAPPAPKNRNRAYYRDDHHICLTYDQKKLRLFVDGAFLSDHAVSGLNTNPNNAFSIGHSFNNPGNAKTTGWVGVIDSVSIFSKQLSAGQVRTLYNRLKDGKSPFVTGLPLPKKC